MKKIAPVLIAALLSTHLHAAQLEGIWESTETLTSTIKGPVYLARDGDTYTANFARQTITAHGDKRIRFDFGAGKGSLRVMLDDRGNPDVVHWKQPRLKSNGTSYLSPVKMLQYGPDRWRVEPAAIEDTFTIYLVIQRRADGTLGGFLRNPDRNVGLFVQPSRITLDGNHVSVFGRFRGRGDEQLFIEGTYSEVEGRLSLYMPFASSTFDFRRADATSHFYARGREPAPYQYSSPPVLDDGWQVAALCEAAIDPKPIQQMVEKEIDPVPDSVNAHDLHGVLIARHGKLVYEEYFHGYHRDLAHDTRSASKSLTATLYGAALEAGLLGNPESKVVDSLKHETDDPRKQAITAAHLLTQTSGFYCDDGNPDAPGNEERMQEQSEQPDWYTYTMNVPMSSTPGSEAVYCSANSNLLGAVMSETAGKPLEHLFHRLIAEPMQLGRYHLNLQPTGEPYMGGGIRWLPRDFLKLGQLYLNDGTWNGNRIISKVWSDEASSSQVRIGDRGYGYQWWVEQFPYGDEEVEVFYAGGNGGQIIAVVRKLDLVVGFFGGNYSDPILYKSQNVLFPDYILEAVRRGEQSSCER